MCGTCRTYGRGERYMQGLEGKPEGKRQLGRPGHKWEDSSKTDQEVGWQDMEWSDPAQSRIGWRAVLHVIRATFFQNCGEFHD
jgi:hypothetical protein